MSKNLVSFLNNKKIIAVSNYAITPKTEEFISKYDCIIRFNSGSNPLVLNKYSYYNQLTDICVISGWRNANFGPMSGFKDQNILFSRPKCSEDIKYNYKYICVPQEFENLLKDTKSINYIPLEYFYDFYNTYNYDHPTTGLITLYYIKEKLNYEIDCLNFFIDDQLYNIFENKYSIKSHNIHIEKKILDSLRIKQIKICA